MKEDNYSGCGISQIWATDERDPFYDICLMHDAAYEKGSEIQKILSRKHLDKLFLNQCLEIAGSSIALKIKAYVYYSIVRSFGWLYWEGKK